MDTQVCVELSKLTSLPPCATTPDKIESESAALNFDDSPLSDPDSSPRTPKDSVFDSFAPGPDELMLAPLVNKQANKSKLDVARRLNFDSCVVVKEASKQEEEAEEDEVLLTHLYKSLLDAIVKEVLLADEVDVDSNGLKTPTKLPLLTGIADTCPAAPKKSRLVSKKIDLELCRKLQF